MGQGSEIHVWITPHPSHAAHGPLPSPGTGEGFHILIPHSVDFSPTSVISSAVDG
ncbi:hypothetical protein [Azospirillum endophyticum]